MFVGLYSNLLSAVHNLWSPKGPRETEVSVMHCGKKSVYERKC